jgi:hypothetical protein
MRGGSGNRGEGGRERGAGARKWSAGAGKRSTGAGKGSAGAGRYSGLTGGRIDPIVNDNHSHSHLHLYLPGGRCRPRVEKTGLLMRATRTVLALLAALAAPVAARADGPQGLLETIHKHVTRTSTVTDNGDLNPYAVVVAPISAGKIKQGDVLIDNFNNVSNLQGTGTTIVDYDPTTKATVLFAKLPQNLPQCPGGIGLTAAMTMLKSGFVIVGSTPSNDGTTRTKGAGCLVVFDANGQLVATWADPNINGPWGNMATLDNGSRALLFISMAGFDIPGPEVRDPATGYPVTMQKATVVRLTLAIPDGKPPAITDETVIASGFGARADKGVFMIGPTGLALAADGTLYASDALANRIVAIPNATTRSDSAGTGQTVTEGGLLKRPLALAMTGTCWCAMRSTASSSRSISPPASSSMRSGSTRTRRSRRPAMAICSASP